MVVLDLSRYDIQTFNVHCFKDNGVESVILASFKENEMRACAEQCQAVGLPIIGFYGFIYFGNSFGETRDTLAAIRLAQEFNISRVWIDSEVDADPSTNGFTLDYTPTSTSRVQVIHKCVDLVEGSGLEAGIYTGSWWWPSGTNRSTAFSHLPLWNSYYDQDPDIDGLPYGGWTTAAIEQYSSTYNICGRKRDVNYVYEEDEMTPEQQYKLDAVYNALCAGDKTVIDSWNTNGNSMILGYNKLFNTTTKLAEAAGINIE